MDATQIDLPAGESTPSPVDSPPDQPTACDERHPPHACGFFDWRLGELFRCRELITFSLSGAILSRTKQTILGPLWHAIIQQPLSTTLVFTVVFGRIAKYPPMARLPCSLHGRECRVDLLLDLFQQDISEPDGNAFAGKVYFHRFAI